MLNKLLLIFALFSAVSPAHAIVGKYLKSKEIPPGICYLFFGHYQKEAAASGIIINNKWVLTAAHSRENGDPLEIHCRGFNSKTEIEKVFIHPGYYLVTTAVQPSAQRPLADLMLIKIRDSFKAQSFLPVLKDENRGLELVQNSQCAMYGAAGTDVWNNGERYIRAAMAPPKLEYYNSDRTLMVEGSSGGQQGDSGGPLLCKDTDKQTYLVGILSYISLSAKYRSFYNFLPHQENWQWVEQIISEN